MKTETKEAISGLKVAGVIALLASLLLLLPVASAESFAVKITVGVDDATVYDGQTVTFSYKVTNAGDTALDSIEIGGVAPVTVGPLEPGVTEMYYEEYTVDLADFVLYSGRYYLPNNVLAVAYYEGDVVSRANSRVTLIGPYA